MEVDIKFEINSEIMVEQVIQLDLDITRSEFIQGLESGLYVTSTCTKGLVFERTPSFKIIGHVIYCNVKHDYTHTNFALNGRHVNDD